MPTIDKMARHRGIQKGKKEMELSIDVVLPASQVAESRKTQLRTTNYAGGKVMIKEQNKIKTTLHIPGRLSHCHVLLYARQGPISHTCIATSESYSGRPPVSWLFKRFNTL